MQPEFRRIAVLDLLLNRENPRHVSKDNQSDIIEYLLRDEEVYNLARHMSQNGINPLEVVAVFADEDGNLVVAEGNRRICAAQLLTDPEKAPESSRARFRKLSARSRDVSQVTIAEFEEYGDAQPWLQVLHDGEQDGVGRKRWKPEQKARATTSKSTDALAVALLDYAEQQGIISKEIRQGLRVSTATRYLANPEVRRAMGLSSMATSDHIEITTSTERFAKVLVHFFDGIRAGQLTSRSKTNEWLAYASELEAAVPFEPGPRDAKARVGTGSIKKPLKKISKGSKVRIVTPEIRFIGHSSRVAELLNELHSFKLSSLYKSLTSISLQEHPVLVTTGAWVFLECLTTLHGKTGGTEFVGYINGKTGSWHIDRERSKDCKLSLDYISGHGNAQKHSAVFTAIDAANLHNHMEVLDIVLVKLLEDCVRAKFAKP